MNSNLNARWLIYGANGYTGRLLAEEAMQRGHRPILAGRSAEKLAPLAVELGLEYRAFSVEEAPAVLRSLRENRQLALVLNAAGPFIYTADAMIEACLSAGVHYLDITGEIPVFESAFRQDVRARDAGIAILCGVGFDIVPSDCLVSYVAAKIADPVIVESVIDALGFSEGGELGISRGTMKTMLEMLPNGALVRRGGTLMPVDFGAGAKTFPFSNGERTAMPIPWGDVSTVYHATGIPNITAYMTVPPQVASALQVAGFPLKWLLSPEWVRSIMAKRIDRTMTGPSETARETGRAYFYARAENAVGQTAEAWLETPEGYKTTAIVGVRAVEQTLAGNLRGALSPSQAFGADFILEVEGTRRMDMLPLPMTASDT